MDCISITAVLYRAIITSCLMLSAGAASARILPPGQPGTDTSDSTPFGSFASANAVAVDPLGFVYVLDAGTNKVIKFSPEGRKLSEVGGYGWGDQTFDHPYDICAQNGLDVYVADYGNHRIQRFDRNLSFVSSFASSSPGADERIFGYPKSVAISNSGSLFFIDGENREIVKLTTANQIERSFGGFGSGKGKLQNPARIRIDPGDHVFVLDGDVIRVFDIYGNYLTTLGEGYFRSPSVFAVRDSKLYILDSCSVVTLDESGNVLGSAPVTPGISGPDSCTLRDIAVAGDALFLLTEHRLIVEQHFFDNHDSGEVK